MFVSLSSAVTGFTRLPNKTKEDSNPRSAIPNSVGTVGQVGQDAKPFVLNTNLVPACPSVGQAGTKMARITPLGVTKMDHR